MFSSWGKFVGWKVLEFFLENNEKIHLNGLAKKLKISKSSANTYLLEYEKTGILHREKTANLVFYRLKESPLSYELKKTLILSKLKPLIEKFLEENKHISSLCLYGSHAKGTYDNKSDLDLIAISQQKKLNLSTLNLMEEKIGKQISLQIYTRTEWKNLTRQKNEFSKAVLKQNILLFGEQL